MRRLAVAVVSIAFAATWMGTLAAEATAHAALEETHPENGALLEVAPDEIRLAFTEPPDPSLTTIGVVDGAGTPIPTGTPELAGTNRGVHLRLDDLADGVYTVAWRTVSTVDGHVTSGAFTFGVGVTSDEVAPAARGSHDETPPPTVAAVAGRWGLYVGLAVLLGGAMSGLLAFGPRSSGRGWLLGSAWALAAVGVVVMTLEERSAVGVRLGTLLASDSGTAFVRLAVAVAIVGIAVLLVTLRPGTITLVVLAAAATAAMAVRATGGHAGSSDLQAVLQGFHFAAAATWVGGLAWLVVATRRGLAPERVRRYSNLAAAGLAVLFLSGLLRASNELGGPTWWLHAFETDYGTALVAKLAIVAPLVALGALNRFRNVRRVENAGPRPLLRTVGGELVLAAGVFAMTGFLTGLPPQLERTERGTDIAGAAPLVAAGSDFGTTTRVRLEVSPGTVGPNTFAAQVNDYDTGEPVDARGVSLTFELPDRPEVSSELELRPGKDGAWRADGTALALDGTWSVTALVETATGSVEVPLQLTPKAPEFHVEVSRAESQPDIYTITFEGGVAIQAYVDPGEPGRTNQVHVTAFGADGTELTLHHAQVEITPSEGPPARPELDQLSPGHFAANVEIRPGTSSFALEVLVADGSVLRASFDQTFEDRT